MESSTKEDDAVNDQKTAESLLGAVRLPVKTGGMKPSREVLMRPLPDEDYAAWCFCTGCGTVLPVLGTAIPKIVEVPEGGWKGRYVSVAACDCCDEQFREAHVLELPLAS